MTKRTLLFFTFLAAFLFSFNWVFADVSSLSAAAIAASPERSFTHKYKNISYWIFFPKKYGLEERDWPMIVYLHGASERGKSMASLKQNVTYHFLDSLKQIDNLKDFPFIVVAPRCPAGQYWNPSQVKGVMDDAISYSTVDENRIYLTGHSMGGFGTWRVAHTYPKLFAAIVPVSGGGNSLLVQNLTDVPTWVFHGERDSVVPVRRSTSMVSAMKKAGGDVKLTLFPKKGHTICRETFSNPELWKWLLNQERNSTVRTSFAGK